MIKIVEEKLKNCTLSLSSLKQVANELNMDYKNLQTQVNTLGFTFKEIGNGSTSSLSPTCIDSHSISRTSSLSSIVGDMSEQQSSCEEFLSSDEELERTFILVKGNLDGTASEVPFEKSNAKWRIKKRSSVGTVSSSESNSEAWGSGSDEDSSDFLSETDKLVKMLIQKSFM